MVAYLVFRDELIEDQYSIRKLTKMYEFVLFYTHPHRISCKRVGT